MAHAREDECPLCCEEFSVQDKNFRPCQCGYEICMWCWHHIKNDMNGLCPNCRAAYPDDPHKFSKVDREELLKQSKTAKRDKKKLVQEPMRERNFGQGPVLLAEMTPEQRRLKEQQQLELQEQQRRTLLAQRLQQQQARAAAERGLPPPPGPGLQAPSSASMQPSAVAGAVGNKGAASSAAAAAALPPSAFPGLPPPTPPPQDRKNLQNIRVVQRNLIYVIGISPSLASEEVLRRADFFGQYGRIAKVVVNRNHSTGGGDSGSSGRSGLSHETSASAYITFVHKEDARACINAVDGFELEGRMVRASFGTTKYCNAFLRHAPCTNPDCLYLHTLGDDEDSFTKEQIQSNHGANGPLKQATAVNSGHKSGGPSSSAPNATYRVTGAGGPSRTGRVASSAGALPPPSYEVPASDPRAKAIAARAAAAAPQQQQPSQSQAPSPVKATGKPPQQSQAAAPQHNNNSSNWSSEMPQHSQPQQPPGFEKLSEIWGTSSSSSAASAPAGSTGGGCSNDSSSFGHPHGGFGEHSAFASALFPSSGLGSGGLSGDYGGSSSAFASTSGLLCPAGKVGGYASSRDNVFSLLATALPPHPGGGNYSGGGDSLSSGAYGGGGGGAAAINSGSSSMWGSGGNSGGGSIWGNEQPDPWGGPSAASDGSGGGNGGNTAGRALSSSQGPQPPVPPPQVARKPEGSGGGGGGGTGMSGMAMLQQMLPGVNLTYGSGASGGPQAEQPQQQQQSAGDIWGNGGGDGNNGGGIW